MYARPDDSRIPWCAWDEQTVQLLKEDAKAEAMARKSTASGGTTNTSEREQGEF